MAKTLKQACDTLQELHRAIPGVQWAPYLDDYPRGEVARSNMPCVLVIPGDGSWTNPFGMGCRSDDRIYDILVMVTDTGSGINTENYYEIVRLIDEFGELYNGNSVSTESGGDLQVIISEGLPSDTGLDDEIIQGDTRYYGFRFSVRMWRKATT